MHRARQVGVFLKLYHSLCLMRLGTQKRIRKKIQQQVTSILYSLLCCITLSGGFNSRNCNRKALEDWPQYSKHIIEDARGKHHVHLNVFEYFIFWTAFYVLRSSQVSGSYNPQAAPRGYGHLTPSFGSVRKVR